jgi:NADPH-dependent 2,4-dienoyl-CoA reductase/sulfur reductase-like enzyme
VVGASFGGISLARTVNRLVPGLEIVLIERDPFFVLAPAQLRYLFGLVSLAEIARGYEALARQGLRILRTAVVAIDRDRRRVLTAAGMIEYDYLVLASGIRLAYEDVPGLAERPDVNLCPYDIGLSLVDLRQRIASFQGGHVVIGTPNSPYKCQPAPYEYALLWATTIKRRRLRARVTFIDPRSRPAPPALAEGLLNAMEGHGEVLTYEPFAQIRAVDPDARTVETEVGRLSFDVLSVIPPNRALPFIAEAGLGDPFVEVDPRTFRATRDERIYAVGDNADTPYAKTGYTAMDSARIAGEWIAGDLGAKRPEPGRPANLCYPMVAPDRALRLETHWAFEPDASGAARLRVRGTTDDQAKVSYARLRREWETRTLSTLFGR